jgi:tetratricopeptide (TPR) repeat protein
VTSLLEDLRGPAPTAAKAVEYLVVPRRFTEEQALEVLRVHVSPNGYSPALLALLKETGILRRSDEFLTIAEETRLPALKSLLPDQVSAIAVAWQGATVWRPEDSSVLLDAAYLGLLAGVAEGANSIRSEFGQAEAEGELERQSFLARLAGQGEGQYGLLPAEARASLYYVLGISRYHRGDRARAMSYFEKAVDTGARTLDVAICAHLLANQWAKKRTSWAGAESLYHQSIAIGEELRDASHTGQAQHSYANLLTRDPERFATAEAEYLKSIASLEDAEDSHGVAITKHSYANLLAAQSARFVEAEVLYLESLATLKGVEDQFGVAQVEHSYANLLAEDPYRWAEARALFEKTLATGKRLELKAHVSQVKFRYGEFLCASDIDRGLGLRLLRESLDLEKEMHSQFADRVRKVYEFHLPVVRQRKHRDH